MKSFKTSKIAQIRLNRIFFFFIANLPVDTMNFSRQSNHLRLIFGETENVVSDLATFI